MPPKKRSRTPPAVREAFNQSWVKDGPKQEDACQAAPLEEGMTETDVIAETGVIHNTQSFQAAVAMFCWDHISQSEIEKTLAFCAGQLDPIGKKLEEIHGNSNRWKGKQLLYIIAEVKRRCRVNGMVPPTPPVILALLQRHFKLSDEMLKGSAIIRALLKLTRQLPQIIQADIVNLPLDEYYLSDSEDSQAHGIRVGEDENDHLLDREGRHVDDDEELGEEEEEGSEEEEEDEEADDDEEEESSSEEEDENGKKVPLITLRKI